LNPQIAAGRRIASLFEAGFQQMINELANNPEVLFPPPPELKDKRYTEEELAEMRKRHHEEMLEDMRAAVCGLLFLF